mmetsp:Transcript_114824/g.319808  ORF Transcript_114824/g.319808 Transcript_114824/m.319808 type:complete len:529 (+) Transcript_114824:55-1641(+)
MNIRDASVRWQNSIRACVGELSEGMCCLCRERMQLQKIDEEQERALAARNERRDSSSGILRKEAMFLEHRRWEELQETYSVNDKILGSGAFGVVFRATLKSSPRIVRAVKKVRKTSLQSEKITRREISILRELDHPNICRCYESYEDNHNIYIVSELIEGRDLFEELQQSWQSNAETWFSEAVTAHVMRQVFSALSYCHGHGIIHRDLKPENIMVRRQSQGSDLSTALIKVIDWGLAVLLPADGFHSPTVEGSRPYLAPEARDGDFSEVSDTWSAGIILHFILIGCLPKARNPRGMLGPTATISPSARALLMNLLEQNPAKRLTAASALKHPWISGSAEGKSPQGGPAWLSRLGGSFASFHQTGTLRRAFITAVAMQISGDRFQDAIAQFQAIDADGNGVISKEEFVQALKNTLSEGVADWGESTWESMFHNIDTDGSGEIEFTEIEATMLSTIEDIAKDAMEAAFQMLDSDNSGKISVAEVARFVRKDGDELAEWLPQFDLNGDGEIDIDEFKQMCGAAPSPSTTCA